MLDLEAIKVEPLINSVGFSVISTKDAEAIVAEVKRLRDAIIEHRSQKADDRCWMDDSKLYEALGDGIPCDRRVGSKPEMLENCRRFVTARCEAGGPWKSYAALEEENERLREEVSRLKTPMKWVGPSVFDDPPLE